MSTMLISIPQEQCHDFRSPTSVFTLVITLSKPHSRTRDPAFHFKRPLRCKYKASQDFPSILQASNQSMLPSCIRIHQGIFFPTSKALTPRFNQSRSNFRPVTTTSTMSGNSKMESASLPASAPGEHYEPRQTHPSEDYTQTLPSLFPSQRSAKLSSTTFSTSTAASLPSRR